MGTLTVGKYALECLLDVALLTVARWGHARCGAGDCGVGCDASCQTAGCAVVDGQTWVISFFISPEEIRDGVLTDTG